MCQAAMACTLAASLRAIKDSPIPGYGRLAPRAIRSNQTGDLPITINYLVSLHMESAWR